MNNFSALKAAWMAWTGSSGVVLLTTAIASGSHAAGQAMAIRSDGMLGARTSEETAGSPGDVIRTIQDPHSGQSWLLLRNEDHPGGPGRLLLADTRLARSIPAAVAESAQKPKGERADHSDGSIVIHAGDRLVVEEHTAIADVQLEAVALASAKAGATLAVRLKIGGRVERAVAVAPGRAAFGSLPATTPEALP